ncbi:MAG: RNA 2',3'-cyclic phosphodiesterase [Syntrophomonadaceae bacterium]|jgi:2'-5' RNA ligase
MRAFIAIPVPEAVKEQVEKAKSQLLQVNPDIKWVEYNNYHLTLKFLGEINGQQVQKIGERLRQVGECSPPFYLAIRGMGFFPNRRKPRVAWIGMDGELNKAEFLAERIDAYLQDLGFEPEKSHRLHLTLGRIRSERSMEALLAKVRQIEPSVSSGLFPVQAFYLMESRLSQIGPHYRIEQVFALQE